MANLQATCASLTAQLETLRGSSQLSKKRGAQCTHCDKVFKCASDLEVHRRTHTGEKPYECDVCSKQFRTTGHLVRHSRIHSGQKPYKCHVCDQAFSQSGHVKRHVKRMHTGEKSDNEGTWFTCDICPRKFSRRGYLNMHIRGHDTMKPYVCSECQKHFHTAADFRLHY